MSEVAYWAQQTILVTGSSRGIGRDVAIRFSQLGAKVAINYANSPEKAQETLQLCNPEKTKMYRADVSKENEVQVMIESIEKDLGAVTVLVNNAGITRDGLLMIMPTDDWRAVMGTHLDGAFYCTRAVLKGMVSNKHGRVINVTSVSGVKGTAGQTNYSAAKAGLIGFTKALAREMGKKKINCNAVALGLIETEMTSVLGDDVREQYRQSTSLKRFGKPDEVADLIEFLAGPKSSYITGQVVTLDGGIV